MNSIFSSVTVIFFLFSLFRLWKGIKTYGVQWEWGRYGMPRSLVTPDADFYLDGTAVNPLQSQLIRAGVEEEVLLALFSVFAIVLVLLAFEVRRMLRLKRLLADLDLTRAQLRAEQQR